MGSQLDFAQNRPSPEKFVCGDLIPNLFKGKYDPSEVPTISRLIVVSDEGLWKSVQPDSSEEIPEGCPAFRVAPAQRVGIPERIEPLGINTQPGIVLKEFSDFSFWYTSKKIAGRRRAWYVQTRAI